MRVRIEHIRDGDTLVVNTDAGSTDLRLYGIDCPELAQEPFGRLARTRLKALLKPYKEVEVVEVNRDQYNRLVGEVWVDDCCVNTQLLSEGFAVAYRHHLIGDYRARYLQAEDIARKHKLQFWSQAEIELPWDFRRRTRKQMQANVE